MKKIKGFFFSGTSHLVTAIPQREFPWNTMINQGWPIMPYKSTALR
jgi:hypothetical protein